MQPAGLFELHVDFPRCRLNNNNNKGEKSEYTVKNLTIPALFPSFSAGVSPRRSGRDPSAARPAFGRDGSGNAPAAARSVWKTFAYFQKIVCSGKRGCFRFEIIPCFLYILYRISPCMSRCLFTYCTVFYKTLAYKQISLTNSRLFEAGKERYNEIIIFYLFFCKTSG